MSPPREPARAEALWCDDPRFSTSGSAEIARLDFSSWYCDHTFSPFYLHVPCKASGDPDTLDYEERGETWHRVHPRGKADGALGVQMIGGRLAWDPPTKFSRAFWKRVRDDARRYLAEKKKPPAARRSK